MGRIKKKYNVGAGLKDELETKLYLFYPCKLINNFLKIVIDFHCLRIASLRRHSQFLVFKRGCSML